MDPLTRLFHLRPFGFLYMLYKRILILAKTPFQAVLYLLGVNKLRSSWTLKKVLVLSAIREIINAPARTGISGGRDHTKEVAAKDCIDAKFIWVNGVPEELVVGEIKRLAQICGAQSVHIPAYGFGNWGSSGDLARDGEKIVLNLHGGGYIIGTAHPEDLTANIPRGYLSYGISRVFSVDYRLSTTHPYPTVAPFPSALLDALAGYVHLTRTLGFKPQNVIMSGDSAGANLALALIRYLRDSPELGLGMPGGLVVISPWTDPVGTYIDTLTNRSPAVMNSKVDFLKLVGMDGNMTSRHEYALRALVGPMSIEDAGRNPYIAPGSSHLTTGGLFKGFPPTYIVGGEAEALIQEIRVLQSRMKEDCEVVYDEVLDAVHDFVVFPQWEPERSETFKKIADWIQNL
ncbi:Esterase OS=Acinetobacter lwoffii GN=est PE=3 SV=2 [Rhizoctonia solani AG-1 IB]|uniref:Esterase n=1 Tax=Thanatephorus cucumeris (strain AG1-IB / isolate 7/3/14) TaxID=1108050 RepID=M5CEN9_THACB|nr:Esterase [Rhizoctonia solani AG-1 IB]CEL59413.1 Esterase OS=Acinetobacter lwoffii GN=est PE=3 SV=2 [Rhizoctonia solani AG-1 IB]